MTNLFKINFVDGPKAIFALWTKTNNPQKAARETPPASKATLATTLKRRPTNIQVLGACPGRRDMGLHSACATRHRRSSPMRMRRAVWKSCSSLQVGCSRFSMSQTRLCSRSQSVAYMQSPGRSPNTSWPIASCFSLGMVDG